MVNAPLSEGRVCDSSGGGLWRLIFLYLPFFFSLGLFPFAPPLVRLLVVWRRGTTDDGGVKWRG